MPRRHRQYQKGGLLSAESAPVLVTRIAGLGRKTHDEIKRKLNTMNLVDDIFRSALTKYGLEYTIVGLVVKAAAVSFMTDAVRDYDEMIASYDAKTETGVYGFDDYVRDLLDEAKTEQCSQKLSTLGEPAAAEDVAAHADFIAKCAWRPYIMHGRLPELKQHVARAVIEKYGDAEKNDGTMLRGVADVAVELGYDHELRDAFKKGLIAALDGIEIVAEGGKRSGPSGKRSERRMTRKKSKGRRQTRKHGAHVRKQ